MRFPVERPFAGAGQMFALVSLGLRVCGEEARRAKTLLSSCLFSGPHQPHDWPVLMPTLLSWLRCVSQAPPFRRRPPGAGSLCAAHPEAAALAGHLFVGRASHGCLGTLRQRMFSECSPENRSGVTEL